MKSDHHRFINRSTQRLHWRFLLLYSLQLIAAADRITDEFQPTVTWFCSEEGGFDLTLTTSEPFFGSLHAMDRYQSCRINGTGRKQLHYYIAFTNTQECNVKYDKKNDLYSIQMEVNEHPVLILQQDRIFDLICAGGKIDVTNKSDTMPQHNASQHLSRVRSNENNSEVSFRMEIVDGDEQALNKVVVYGMPYSLRIVMNTSDAHQHFKVVNCRAHDATHNATVQLTNWNGCSLNYNLFSDFVYEENHATAQLPTMFRFPMNDVVQFECVMIICQDQADCNSSSCERFVGDSTSNDELSEQAITRLLQNDITAEEGISDLRREYMATTPVTVAKYMHIEKMLPQYVKHSPVFELSSCVSPSDLVVLYKLCVILCAIFTVGCVINVLFCIYINSSNNSSKKRRREVSRKVTVRNTANNNNKSDDFWIKDTSISPVPVDDTFKNGSIGDCIYGSSNRFSLASDVSVRQKSFRCFTQLPDKIGDANFETPSPKSSVSTRQSTFANPPHHLTNSVTVETDLNSQYSSSATATTIEPTDITDHRINNDLPLPLPTTFNNAIFMRRHQNDRESYSIL